MFLRDLIKRLEQADPDRKVARGFCNPHSYRGYYECLAFQPKANTTIAEMLSCAREALGSTYTGWKGGEFTMGEYTDVYLAFPGETGEELGPTLLDYMIGNY